MRLVSFFCAGLLASAALISAANAAPNYPKGAVALETQLLAAQSADTKAFIKDEAGREATSHILSEETPRSAARKNGATGSDVSAVAFLVLMEAARAADANVALLVNGVQSDAASRQDVRQQAMQTNGIAGAQQAQMSSGTQTAQKQQGKAFISLLPNDKSGDPIKNAIDGAREPRVATPPTMNLQDAMDRQTQIEDLLAQAMKRVSQPG